MEVGITRRLGQESGRRGVGRAARVIEPVVRPTHLGTRMQRVNTDRRIRQASEFDEAVRRSPPHAAQHSLVSALQAGGTNATQSASSSVAGLFSWRSLRSLRRAARGAVPPRTPCAGHRQGKPGSPIPSSDTRCCFQFRKHGRPRARSASARSPALDRPHGRSPS